VEVERLGGTVSQIKEKYGGLRFYYSPGDSTADLHPDWDIVENMVDDAEQQSLVTCEMCGQPGVLMTSGHWLKTLCADDALQLGYKKRA